MTAPTITKKDLIDRVAALTNQTRVEVKRTLQTFLDQVISDLAKGNRIEFRDFGVFEIRVRAPRTAQNPRTLEPVHVPARRTVKFKVGRVMKQCLEKPESIEALLAAAAMRREVEERGRDTTGLPAGRGRRRNHAA